MAPFFALDVPQQGMMAREPEPRLAGVRPERLLDLGPGGSCERAGWKCTFGKKPGGGWGAGTELQRPSTVRSSRRGGRGRAHPPSGRHDTGRRAGARRRRGRSPGATFGTSCYSTPTRDSRRRVVGVDEAFRATLEAESPSPVHFYTEYLDLTLFDGDEPQRELRALLRRKYESRSIDLIVAAGSRALRAALHNRVSLFSGAPVVFLGVDRASVADLRLGTDVTGTWLRQDWIETLELARRLQPDIRKAVVVAGSAPADLGWLAAARQQLGSGRQE